MTSYVYYAFVGFFYFMVASASFAGAPLPSDQYNFMMAVKSCLNEAPIDGLCSNYAQSSGYGLMPDWDTSQVTDMSSSFGRQAQFNGDISSWNTSNVTRMTSMFLNSGSFNQNISSWDVSNVTSMKSMFHNAYRFNQDISNWDTSNVTDMSYMFAYNSQFSHDIRSWNVSSVSDFTKMFLTSQVVPSVMSAAPYNAPETPEASWFTVPDTVAPILSMVSISSSNNDTAKAIPGDVITLSFTANEAIQLPTVTFSSGGTSVNGTVSVQNTSANTWTATFVAKANDTAGPVTYSIAFSDTAGNAGTAVTSTSDGTAVGMVIDTGAPALMSSTPSDNSSGVNLDQNILLTFSEDVLAGSGDIKLFESNGNLVETFVVSSAIISGSRVTVNPTQNFKSDTGYYVQISASAFVDTASNNYPGITDQTTLNFTTRKANASEAFNEVKDKIGSKIQSNTTKQISSFATATTAVVSAARSRAVSKRSSNNSASRSSSSRATGGGNGDQTGGADTGVSEADNELNIRISSKNANAEGTFGSIFRAYGSKLTRYTETQFGYSKSESNRETLNISSQIIYENEKSDDLTLGYFVGVSLGKDTSNDTMKVDIENSGLQVGSYFVRNLTQKVFVDGYVAGSKLFNRMEVATSAMTAEADYASFMVATGLAVTGSATASRWEILPTLAIDYTVVSSENAAFVVTSGAGNSSELSDPGNPRQLGITLASDFRTPFDYYEGYWSQGSTLSFKPHVTCQRVYENGIELSEECGRGAAINLSSQDANATKTLSFTLGINEIAGDATFSGSILYKAEF